MSSISSACLQISPPPLSCCGTTYQPLFADSILKKGGRNPPTAIAQQGNLLSTVPAVAFSCRKHNRTIKFLAFKRNNRLPTRENVEFVEWVEEDVGFPSIEAGSSEFAEQDAIFLTGKATQVVEFGVEVGNLSIKKGEGDIDIAREQSLSRSSIEGEETRSVEEERMPHNEEVHILGQNSELGCAMGRENLNFVREDGSFASNFVERNCEVPSKEDDMFVDIVKEEDAELVDSGNRDGFFPGKKIAKRILNLPIEERVKSLDLLQYEKVLTVSDYNDILFALLEAEDCDCAATLFNELPSRGISPDSWTFSIMVRCSCKKNEPDEARRLLDEMMQSGFHPNVVTFTILVNCLCKKGRLKQAFEIFEIMKKSGCQPSTRTYNCLISGLCYVGRVEEAFKLLNKMKKSSKEPDIYTFTLVMDGFCKVGRSGEAIELLKEAVEMGLTPNIVTYNALLSGYCRERRPLEGLHVLQEMEKENFFPDVISYNTLLQGLLRCGEVSAALGTYKKMRDLGFHIHERVMNTLLRGLCRQCMEMEVTNSEFLNEAKDLFDKIAQMDYGLSPYTYCLMVQALAKGGEIDLAITHLIEMVRSGYSPRMLTYNIILRVLCGEGRVDDALSILVLMIKRDTIPSRFSFSVLLDEFRRQERLLDAFGVYGAALKWGLSLGWKPRTELKDDKELLLAQREEIVT